MSYMRVIPRDLFNEASLLKCYGKIALHILDRAPKGVRFASEEVEAFDIVQRDDDGAIFIRNLPLIVGQWTFRLIRPLNSRRDWPLYAEMIDGDDAVAVDVFNEDGSFTNEMLVLFADGESENA